MPQRIPSRIPYLQLRRFCADTRSSLEATRDSDQIGRCTRLLELSLDVRQGCLEIVAEFVVASKHRPDPVQSFRQVTFSTSLKKEFNPDRPLQDAIEK